MTDFAGDGGLGKMIVAAARFRALACGCRHPGDRALLLAAAEALERRAGLVEAPAPELYQKVDLVV